MNQAKLYGTNLNRADLTEAALNEAKLNGATLCEANLHKADLGKANLSWANLSGANIAEANLSEADLSEAVMPSSGLHTAVKCPTCKSTQIRKNGHRHNKQSYICKSCKRQFIESYATKGYSDTVKEQCLKLYANGMGFRAIERETGVNHNTIINWVRQATTVSIDTPEVEEILGTALQPQG